MENANKPANPIKFDPHIHRSNRRELDPEDLEGLTKKEELAARNYAAIIANIPFNELETDDDWGIKVAAAKQALQGADALLNELNQ